MNFSDPETRRRFMRYIGTLTGPHRVSVKPVRMTRSVKANKYYFVAVVEPFASYLSHQYGEDIDNEQAHEMLRNRVLGMDELVNKETGEVMMKPRKTRTMDTWEFSDYIENCARFLLDFADIVVIPAEEFWESKDKLRKAS